MVKKKKLCIKCLKEIKQKEKYVLLGTYEDEDALNESYFHFKCWDIYFKECVMRKIQSAQNKAFGILKKMTGGMKGG